MWRGFHKMDAAVFERMANLPSSYPSHSPPGRIPLRDGQGQPLFAHVEDTLITASPSLHARLPAGFCERVLLAAEEQTYEEALLNTGASKQEEGSLNPEVRQSQRCILESKELAGVIWDAVRPLLPPPTQVPGPRYNSSTSEQHALQWEAVGVNPTLRILKYEPGDHFELHQDGSYKVESTDVDGRRRLLQQSFLTLQLYLNDGGGVDFQGGATRFITPPASVAPLPPVSVSGSEQPEPGAAAAALLPQRRKATCWRQKQLLKKQRKAAEALAREGKDEGRDEVEIYDQAAGGSFAGANDAPAADDAADAAADGDDVAGEATDAASAAAAAGADAYEINDVVPRKGRLLLFQHNIWHEGQRVVRGTKIVLRSEVMYEQRSRAEQREI
jgi:hypothetical protein